MEMNMSKLKVGDKIRCVDNYRYHNHLTVGKVYAVLREDTDPRYVRIKADHGIGTGGYKVERFELVQEDAVLTPEEVFEPLRRGTKLQQLTRISKQWVDVIHPERTPFKNICDIQWRIKPEPVVIELNGMKYREIID